MENLNELFAKNLIKLRKDNKLTQLELSEELKYSDRNVSKWENGLSLPTVETLKELSDYFQVPMDYFFTEHDEKETYLKRDDNTRIKILVIALSIVGVFLASTILFILFPKQFNKSWLAFVWGAVGALIICVVFYSIWFKKNILLFIFISLLSWSIIAGTYLTLLVFMNLNLWFLFLVGAPIQIAIVFWSRMPRYRN